MTSATTAPPAVFEEMVRDEEKHADWFESQLDAIDRVGLQRYLSQQIDADTGPRLRRAAASCTAAGRSSRGARCGSQTACEHAVRRCPYAPALTELA